MKKALKQLFDSAKGVETESVAPAAAAPQTPKAKAAPKPAAPSWAQRTTKWEEDTH